MQAEKTVAGYLLKNEQGAVLARIAKWRDGWRTYPRSAAKKPSRKAWESAAAAAGAAYGAKGRNAVEALT